MLNEHSVTSQAGRTEHHAIHCDECTIQIGDGYQESVPWEFVDDESPSSPRPLKVCWRCWESLNRRRLKRLAQAAEERPAGP